jgi:hypothetical protein
VKAWSLLGLIPALAGWLLLAAPAYAEAGLQLNPLKYEDVLTPDRVKVGFIDVSNPSDTAVTIHTAVRGFRQADLDGNLKFFNDDQLAAGIKPGLDQFELGPRESIRVAFNVDPSKLPQGGVYAAIFFQTTPVLPDRPSVSYVAEAANVGTLLILRNGQANDQIGRVSSFSLPFWQFGRSLTGRLQYHNTNRDTGGLAFTPQLTGRTVPWGRGRNFTGPFIMPQSTRQFDFVRSGSYFGLLPVTVADARSGQGLTRWVFACTGWYQVVLLVLLAAIIVWLGGRGRWRRLLRQLVRRLRRRKKSQKRPIDGLGPRSGDA